MCEGGEGGRGRARGVPALDGGKVSGAASLRRLPSSPLVCLLSLFFRSVSALCLFSSCAFGCAGGWLSLRVVCSDGARGSWRDGSRELLRWGPRPVVHARVSRQLCSRVLEAGEGRRRQLQSGRGGWEGDEEEERRGGCCRGVGAAVFARP